MATVKFGAVLRHIRSLGERPTGNAPDGDLLQAFIERGDQAAFEVILKRHGAMVLRVCKRVLDNGHDAEDAFQATFLFLAQRAASIRKRASLASWLHGVAQRMATNARRSGARRRKHEGQSRPSPVSDPACDASWHEVQSILDEEIQRLSKTQREPFVRCCLEHRSCAEVAAHMGLQEAAVRSRVARARKLLEQRLARRGVSLTLVCAALAVAGNRATAAVAPTLLGATAAAAVRLTCAQGAQGLVSTQVLALVKGMNQALALARIKTALVFLLGTLLLAGGTALVYGHGLFVESGEQSGESNAAAPLAEVKSQRADQHTDWYGDPLPDEALARLGTVRFRPGDHVGFLRFTPDGTKLITQSTSGVRVWDAASGRELRRFGSVAEKNVAQADVSADGKLALTAEAASNGPLRLWDVSTGRELRQFGNFRLFGPVRLAPDGKIIVAEGPSGELELWDATKAERRNTVKVRNAWGPLVNFAADSKTLVTGRDDKTIRFWDVATGRERQRIDCPEAISSVALSPDQKLLASVGRHETKGQFRGMTLSMPDNRVRVWDAATGKELRQLVVMAKRPGREGISAVAFGPDSKTVVTIGSDQVLRVWDATTGKELRTFAGCSTNSFALALHPDGKAAAFANGGTAVRIVDLDTGKDRVPLGGHSGGIGTALIAPDGKTVMTAGHDDSVRVWEAQTGKEIRRFRGDDRWVSAIALSPCGQILYCQGSDSKLRAWDPAVGGVLQSLGGKYNAFAMMALSADGKLLAGGSAKEPLVLIDAMSGKPIHTVAGLKGRMCYGAGFSADGRTLAAWTGGWTGGQEVYVIDVATGKTRKHYPFAGDKQKEISYIATLSPDGRLVAFGSQNRFLSVLDVDTGAEVRRFEGLPDGVSAVAFSPDAQTLAWGGWNDAPIHLLELSTGGERHRLLGHQGRILALRFSRDARVLVSGGNDATALIWDLTGRRERAAAREKDLPAQEFASLWKELGTADAPQGYQAVRRLGRSPAAVSFLGTKLKPVPVPEEKHVAKLIADLKSDDFRIRDKATKELERLGERVAGACRKALADENSLEARRRLQKLLDQQASQIQRPSPERVRLSRALEALELAGTPPARDLLAALAKGAPGAWLTQQAQAGRERLDRRRLMP